MTQIRLPIRDLRGNHERDRRMRRIALRQHLLTGFSIALVILAIFAANYIGLSLLYARLAP
jgi:hypothetical protein